MGKGQQGVRDGYVHTAIFKCVEPTRTYSIAQGTLINVMGQPGWERSLGENGHMYMQG